jgi:hypothetical protein
MIHQCETLAWGRVAAREATLVSFMPMSRHRCNRKVGARIAQAFKHEYYTYHFCLREWFARDRRSRRSDPGGLAGVRTSAAAPGFSMLLGLEGSSRKDHFVRGRLGTPPCPSRQSPCHDPGLPFVFMYLGTVCNFAQPGWVLICSSEGRC